MKFSLRRKLMLSRKQIIEALQLAERAGCSLVFQYRAPGGSASRCVSPEALADAISGELNLAAQLSGLSPQDYEEWVRLDGSVQCHANTRAGKRCRKCVPGVGQRDASEWKRLNDEKPYCETHGG
ncbi:hypothetical protein ACU4GI_10865 [Cupriavidus basilensis]